MIFLAILYGLPKVIKCTFTVFISLFIIQLRGTFGKNLPNLWQRRLEKPLMKWENCVMSTP